MPEAILTRIQPVLENSLVDAIYSTTVGLSGIDLTTAKGFVYHGSDPNVPRPSGYASVEWAGSVIPVNALNLDTRAITP